MILYGMLIFSLGACIGSFLNVCIYRIPINKSIIFPGSSCPNCQRPIPFYLNIPILSYAALRGRCKFCASPISIRYPLVEAVTGLFGILLYLKFGLSAAMFFWFIFTAVLITVSMIDMAHQIIPDHISIPGIILFSSSSYFLPEMTLMKSFMGILAGGGILYVVAVAYYLIKHQEGMGGGDIKLLAMIGAASGVKGVLFTVFSGSLLGAVAGLITMIYMRRFDAKLKIPFGPFLSVGAVLFIFMGDWLINWYFTLLS